MSGEWSSGLNRFRCPLSPVPCPLCGDSEIEVFQRIARRMLSRDIERFEVMVLVLDLRTVGGRKAEPAHDLFQLFDRLRDRVQPADAERLAGKGRIELRSILP